MSTMISRSVALLTALLAITGLPAAAEELQFDITGEAYQYTAGNTVALGPAEIIFTVDSQSGEVQTYPASDPTFGVPTIFASDMTVTGFSWVINGQSILAPSNLTLGLSAMGNTDFALGIDGVFDWSNISPPASSEQVSAASASNDVIAALFSTYAPVNGDLSPPSDGSLVVATSNTTVRIVGVPEPGPLALFALGLVGVVASRGRRKLCQIW
ncbi:MAG TPA: PEP-CTERM sorting domain-containing protein [Steroidobacteraceae bacterium]|jgi:hypothetical protein